MLDVGTAVVIEDDPEVGVLIQFVLEQAGWQVVVTDDGAAGIEAVRQHHPVLVTLDVGLPGADGFAVARELRTFSDTYLIMVTGMVGEIDIVRGFDAGADDYLVKPFRPRELRARADAMMRRYQSWQARADPGEVSDLPRVEVDAPPQPATGPSWASVAAADLVAAAVPLGDSIPSVAEPRSASAPAPVTPGPVGTADAAAALLTSVAAPTTVATEPTPALASPVPVQPFENVLTLRDLVVRRDARSVSLGSRALSMTTVEFDLLVSLMESGRRVRSKAELALTMRGEGPVPTRFVNGAEKRRVDGSVADLRAKLDDDPTRPRYVETVAGVGYRMVGQP